MESPFLFGSATSGKWFTDRVNDTKRLKANFMYGINTVLISPRRWGKTSLILKVSEEINDKTIITVNIDIFSCRTSEDFYQIFAREIIRQTADKWEEWVANTKKFLSNLTPTISFGSNPNAEFSLSIDLKNTQLNEDVLSLPQKIAQDKGIKIVVCIDEFQQIADFPNSLTFQKKLRSVWQLRSQNVSYCLCGSKKHLLNALFSTQSSPFYKFGDVIFLQKISEEHWIQYICERFSQTGKSITENRAAEICRTVENHSSYVQQFALSANISRIKKSLENKELIDISKKWITFNDPVFRLWFNKEI